jgi:hypothetical protein
MTRTTITAADYCDAHFNEVRHDPGEADPDGRLKKADPGYASILMSEEILRSRAFIERVGFDPHEVILTTDRADAITDALPEFAPFCCTLGAIVRRRVLRRSRHPPIEYEYEQRAGHGASYSLHAP